MLNERPQSILPMKQRLLNVGCGRQFHADWENIDLESVSPEVKAHDVTRGLPYANDSFDAVYHSHILEHLKPSEGRQLLNECLRVLKPGGVLRIVVPDLERIATLYLQMHKQAMRGDAQSEINYRWMKLELLDQLVRDASGGQMGRYMASDEIKNSDFVRSRVGDEYWICRALNSEEKKQTRKSLRERATNRYRAWAEWFAVGTVSLLLGQRAKEALVEGLFRSRGEIHRWMYDRFSLKTLCEELGFDSFRVCKADESEIASYARFELDSSDGKVRKPDSLFVECVKPVTQAVPAVQKRQQRRMAA